MAVGSAPAPRLRGAGRASGPAGAARVVLFAAGLAAALLAAWPEAARALEARFDHRDQDSILVELGSSRDTASVAGASSVTLYRTELRVAYGFDVTGDGDELLLGAALRVGEDAATESVHWAVDARYRGYFGSEDLKTFFDLGLWAPVDPKIAIGPRVGLGLIWDLERLGGIYASFGVATALGQLRAFSLDFAVGVQVRF